MGLFDRFRRAAAPETPTPDAGAAAPAVPCKARIATFDLLDAVGTLNLADGTTLRFGRSACRGFEPVVGADVVVNTVAPHARGGWRAKEIALDRDSASYDQLLAERDAGLGLQRGSATVDAAADACMTLGWIVVLLADAPPLGPQALQLWAERLGLAAHGLRIRTDGDLRIGVGAHDAIAYIGEGPFPRARLGDLGAPGDFDPGRGFIGLSLGLPNMIAKLRAVGDDRDPWAPNGSLRDLSRIAVALLDHACAIVLPQAGTMVSAEHARARFGDVEDPNHRPFTAWTALSVDPAHGTYASYGFGLHGWPDVATTVDPADRWQLERAREAILLACSRMVWSNQPLADDEVLEIPVGGPRDDAMEVDVERYRVIAAERGITLQRLGDPEGTRALWRAQGGPKLEFPTYERLFFAAIADELRAVYETELQATPRSNGPPFAIEVLAAQHGYFLVTNGVGRIRQPGARGPESAHLEIVAATTRHHPLLAHVLRVVGESVHEHADTADAVFKAGDTVGLEVEEIGAAGFVLRNTGAVELARGGPPVQLLELVPLTAREYDEVRRKGSGPWLAKLGPMDPRARADRWRMRQN